MLSMIIFLVAFEAINDNIIISFLLEKYFYRKYTIKQ